MAGTGEVTNVGEPEIGEKGVRYNGPPEELVPEIGGQIQRAVDSIGKADIALVAVADRKGGWNSALVARVGDEEGDFGSVKVITWIGKEWGTNKDLDFGTKLIWAKKF